MIEGKNSYDNISIPEELDSVYTTAVRKAQVDMRRKQRRRFGVAAAACLATVLLCNNDFVYAKTADIPVIGSFVRLLHVGDGGTVTDGAHGKFSTENNVLNIQFQSGESEDMPYYNIQYYLAPRRIEITLSGVRGFEQQDMEKAAAACEGIKDLYFVTVLDDSQVQFIVELEDGYGYQAEEYKNPGNMRLTFSKELYKEDTQQSIWAVRIASMENGEPLAAVKEAYGVDADTDMHIVKTKAELYTITAGSYATEEEAQQAADNLNKAGLSEKEWFLEQVAVNQQPE